MTLHRFYFAHRSLFVVPIEHLSEAGMSAEFIEMLKREGLVDAAWIELFNHAYSTYWTRTAALYAAAPTTWFPPRLQNLCVVLDPTRVRPYLDLFHRSSWLLYASDFDPVVSDLEFATHQLLYTERLGMVRDVAQAMINGASYWMVRSEEEIEAFRAACIRSPRPDAAAFRALADAIPWMQTLFHVDLRQPSGDLSELRELDDTGLLIPPDAVAPLMSLIPALRDITAETLQRYYDSANVTPDRSDPLPERGVTDWLTQTIPLLLVLDDAGELLWDPEQPAETAALSAALEGIAAAPAESLRTDLEIIGERSARFLASLRDPARLPPPKHLDEEGGVYMHTQRRLIAYVLTQPGLDPRREVAPPYHHLLVGARTIHEWGHIAEEVGMIRVPEARRAEHSDALGRVAAAVDRILRDAPQRFAKNALIEARRAGQLGRPSELVTASLLHRMPDLLSNILSRCYLSVEEMEAYLRNNVRLHLGEGLGPLTLLANIAYEYQYLKLSRIQDPLRYLIRSTWLREYLIDFGVLSLEHLRALLRATEQMCACYEIDEDAFSENFRAALSSSSHLSSKKNDD